MSEIQTERQTNSQTEEPRVPHETYGGLFLRFLRFGLLAWGGPVAQIAMIRQELVEDERWISRERFNRLLAVYQVLPGPEAHELCVHFGMLARGRVGGFLSGLGFMLPGFALMFLLSWGYVAFGITQTVFAGAFHGIQPAVLALIVRAVHRIGRHILTNRWLWGIAVAIGLADLLGVPFWITLPLAGLVYVLIRRRNHLAAIALGMVLLGATVLLSPTLLGARKNDPPPSANRTAQAKPSLPALFISGLRSGLLTFGGAYTVIPFLQHDAVARGGFMSDEQFLDGLALSGILPAPLIIFSTFVGYLGGGPLGALALTVGIFLPAFSFSLFFHNYLERVVENSTLHMFLDGISAGVVGLIASTTIGLAPVAVTGLPGLAVFGLALTVLYLWKAKAAVPVVVLAAGGIGFLLFQQ